MRKATLASLKRRHKELSNEIKIMQTKPGGQSPEMNRYKLETARIERKIDDLEHS
jgi:hypothetical protein